MTTHTTHPAPFSRVAVPTVGAVLASYAAVAPDAPLVTDGERSVTAAEVVEVADRLARALTAAGARPGDPIGILMANGWRWVVAYLALASHGFVAIPLNTWYKAAELRSAREKTRMRAVLSQSSLHGRENAALLGEAGLLEPSGGYLGAFLWDGDFPGGLDADAAPHRLPEPTPDTTAAYVFTSGSSAEPKVVVLRHDGLVLNGDAMGRRMGVEPGDALWFAAPLFFGLGCANAVLVSLTHGLRLCVQERFDPEGSAAFIETNRCNVLYALGPMVRAMVQAGAIESHDLSCVGKGLVGLTHEDKRIAIDAFGVPGLRSVYGLTECYGLAAMTEEGDDVETVLSTQGRPVDGHELRVADPVTGEDVEPGDPEKLGEILLRGRVTPGYLDNDDANAHAFTADGWFRTGDLGWLDGEGRLHFAGRLKEVVKINGITVSPAEVETFVVEHPAVSEAYAFGWSAAAEGEEELWCAVVLHSGASLSSEDIEAELQGWLKERISSYKVPRHFLTIAQGAVPLTSTGKVSKRLIGEQFIGSVSKEQS